MGWAAARFRARAAQLEWRAANQGNFMTQAITKIKVVSSRDAGTPPEAAERGPNPGRWKLVGADEQQFLYIPQLQTIYSLPPDVGLLLKSLDSSDDRSGAELLREYVLHLVNAEPPRPLVTQRSSRKGLKTLVVHVCQLCNLDCVYCYAHDLNKAQARMSLDTARAVVERTVALSEGGLENVKFLGGEPTLAWDVIEYLVLAFEREARSRGWPRMSFVMVSNGTGVTEARAEFIASHNFKVLISIDGSEAIHNELRPRKGGSGSFARAVEAVDILVKAGVNTAIEAVYTQHHFRCGVTPCDLADFFSSLGIKEFQITPAVGTWHNEELIRDVTKVGELFERLVRRCVRSLRTDSPTVLRGIQFVLDGLILREKRSHVCGAGRDFMAINYDGEAFPCYLIESADLSYGFVTGRGIDQAHYERIRAKFRTNGKDFHPVCRGCWANEICQSCLGTTFQIEPEIAKPPAWFCAFQKRLISGALGEFAAAQASGDWPQVIKNIRKSLEPIVRMP